MSADFQRLISSKTLFGFWVYLMTDIVLFATLFAAHIVLHHSTFSGPGGPEIFNLNYVLLETIVLLISSFTAGLALIMAFTGQKKATLNWLGLTFVLGLSFLGLELFEFWQLVSEGHSWTASAFFSSFFTLVGTHGLHIMFGLVWMGVMIYKISKSALDTPLLRKLTMLSLFWHFLDIVWIFIFTIVFLIGYLHG